MSDWFNDKFDKEIPEAFKLLDSKAQYRLEKIGNKDPYTFVPIGMYAEGDMTIVNVLDKPGIRVKGPGRENYLRTSPVMFIINNDENSVRFETEGGIYLLTKLKEKKNETI